MADLNLLSALAKELTQLERFGGGKEPVAAVITAAGDNLVRSPAVGNALRVYWVSAVNIGVGNPVIRVKLGSKTLYCAAAIQHWEPFEGAVGEGLTVNLSEASSVPFTAHIVEFTP